MNILLLMGWENIFNSAKYNSAKVCTKMCTSSVKKRFMYLD